MNYDPLNYVLFTLIIGLIIFLFLLFLGRNKKVRPIVEEKLNNKIINYSGLELHILVIPFFICLSAFIPFFSNYFEFQKYLSLDIKLRIGIIFFFLFMTFLTYRLNKKKNKNDI